MNEVVVLGVGRTDAGWRVRLGPRDVRPTEVALSAEAGEALLREISTTLARPTPVLLLVPGRDAAVAAHEEQVGRLLSHLLNPDPTVAAAFGRAEGRAGGRLMVLVADVTDAALRALPWELLSRARGQPLEAMGHVLVARLTDADWAVARDPNRGRVVSLLVRTPEADPEVERLCRALDGQIRALGLPPLVTEAPELHPDDLVIVHVVAHGERDAELLHLQTGGGPGALVSQLLPLLPQTDLVVPSVCHSGQVFSEEFEDLPGRFIRAGARACLAPRGPVRVEAMELFAAGLYEHLAGHHDLLEAVREGRRRLRLAAWPHPDARWHLLALTIGHLGWAAAPPRLAAGWRPDGWPVPGPEAGRLLEEAARFARASEHGYVGVEHLLWALHERPEHRPFWLLGAPKRLEWFLGQLRPTGRPADWSGTPRLRAWGARLSSGFDVSTLTGLLRDDARPLLEALLGVAQRPAHPGDANTITELDESYDGGPAEGLECLGGPEDGLRFFPALDQVIGRWSDENLARWPLFRRTAVEDRKCSRRQLRWDGPGRLYRLAPTSAVGPIEVHEGQIIRVGRVTWLLGVGGRP